MGCVLSGEMVDALGKALAELFQETMAALQNGLDECRRWRAGIASTAANRALERVTCERNISTSSVNTRQRSRPREMLT